MTLLTGSLMLSRICLDRAEHCLYCLLSYNSLTSAMTFLHSVGVYGMIVSSVTGPGRRLRLDLGGIGGCANAGGSEGGQDDRRLDVMSEEELRTRGMSFAIMFAFLSLTRSTVLFSFVLVPPMSLAIASGCRLPLGSMNFSKRLD